MIVAWVDPGPVQEHPIATSASMSNRAPWIPEIQKLGLERQPDPDPGYRVFDPRLLLWFKPLPDKDVGGVRPAAETAVPVDDGSGVFWTVRDRGQVIWRFEAYDFDVALAEKRRLCRLGGFRSGWAYLARES